MLPRALFLLSVSALAQSPYPWLENIANQQLAARREAVAQLKTPAEIRARAQQVRANLLKWIGGLPSAKTPLNIQRTGTIDHPDYRVEKIIFESQPRFFVTANLYIPKTGAGPYPAVLQPTGHSLTAKARELYQSLSIGLVKYGFVVLTYDPLGQGERRIFFDSDLKDSKVGGTTVEHQLVGVQSLLAGESIARQMIWDGIRGLDLLAGLPEVDASKLAVAGCSGGGTLTAYLAALDERVQAAAPACYISSWQEQLAGTGPQDAEQQFPDQLLSGFDHGDFLIATAPRPYLICSTTEDFFPLAGARRTYEEAKYIYNRFGAEDKISWFTAPGDHGMRADTRGAIYAWMRKWLQNKPGPAPESALTVELEENLTASKSGQVGGETASMQNVRRFAAIRPSVTDLPAQVRALTRYQAQSAPLDIQPANADNFTFESEPGRRVPAALHRPTDGNGRVILIADASGKAAPSVRQFTQAGYTVLALDVALIGDAAHRAASYSNDWFPQDKAIWLSLMVGRTVTGLRMTDILRGLDVLEARGISTKSIIGFARGNPGVALLHAAVLDPRLSQLILEDLPPTYRTLATTPIHRQIFDVVIPGVLKNYDLPDLVAHLAPRPVTIGRTVASTETYPSPNAKTIRRRELTPLPETYLAKPPAP